jgi:flagellin
MSLRINHNISAINGHHMMLRNDAALSKSLERLSSGMRINRAADDAAGLVISEQMRAQIAGLGQAIDNSETAVAFVQTTEGTLDEINALLIKARELALHAGNTGVNDDNQLLADQTELDNLIESITRISTNTQFGTKSILDGSLSGAKNFAGGLDRVKVGNLANNPAIATGQVMLQVNPGAREALTMVGSNATNTYVFSGVVTGVTLGTNRVNAGVSVTLSLDSEVVAFVTTGLMDATTVASRLDALAQPHGFTVAANANGEMDVTRLAVGSADFTARVAFTRGAIQQVAGINEKVTSTLEVTLPSTSADAAASMFSGISALSDVQTSTTVASGTTFSYMLQTITGGSFSGAVAVASGTALSSVLATLQTSIQAHATFSGANVTYAGSTANSGLSFAVARGVDDIATDFNFSLTVDYQNNAAIMSQVNAIDLAGAAFSTGTDATFLTGAGGSADVQGNALAATSYLQSGNALNLTISGITLVFTGARTVATLASAMQTQFNALGSDFANVRVAFVTSGTALSGLAGQQNITGAVAAGFHGFLVYNTDGAELAVSLAIDQTQGNDVLVGDAVVITGANAGSTLDLTTVAQSRLDNQQAQSANAATTIASVSGNTVVTSGVDVTAQMTTSNGVILDLISTVTASTGGSTLVLTTGMADLGYNHFSADITLALTNAGGVATFDLDEGAVFQVGPNAGQRVGLVIDSVAATELGRNVAAAGSLRSLNDLHTDQQGALLNGLSVEALAVIDATISEVTTLRGMLGAIQSNTLESGLNSLRTSFENLTSAESTIRDVDFAGESANFTRNQILVQSATAMLAQANQLPQNVLKLLQ